MAGYNGRALGAMASRTFSFTKPKPHFRRRRQPPVSDPDLVPRAEIIREQGTDRAGFFRGDVDKYTWQDVGLVIAAR